MKIVFESRVYYIYSYKTVNNIEGYGSGKIDPFYEINLHKMYYIYIDENGKRNISFLFFSEREFQEVYLKKQELARPFIIIFSNDFSDVIKAKSFPQDPMFSLNIPDILKYKESRFLKKILETIRKP